MGVVAVRHHAPHLKSSLLNNFRFLFYDKIKQITNFKMSQFAAKQMAFQMNKAKLISIHTKVPSKRKQAIMAFYFLSFRDLPAPMLQLRAEIGIKKCYCKPL